MTGLGRDAESVSIAPPAIEAIFDDLGTGGWRIPRDSGRAIAHLFGAVRPRGVLEFGSGVSTIVFAALAQTCGIDTRIVSIEENPDYAESTRQLLQRHGLAERASVIVAPVADCCFDGWRGSTYRPSDRAVENAFGTVQPDFVFIDGPASWLLRRGDCRFGTLLLARRWLAESSFLVADDAFRRRERSILKRWAGLRGVKIFGILPVGRGLGLGVVHTPAI